jgi:hypothetical protein
MAYRRELWHIISGSEVRFMCNITPPSPRVPHGQIVYCASRSHPGPTSCTTPTHNSRWWRGWGRGRGHAGQPDALQLPEYLVKWKGYDKSNNQWEEHMQLHAM